MKLIAAAPTRSYHRSEFAFPDHVDDTMGEVVFGTPSQVVFDRGYREAGVVDVSGTFGAMTDLCCRIDLPLQHVQELKDAGRDSRADVPRAV
jgi:hypothetical protein